LTLKELTCKKDNKNSLKINNQNYQKLINLNIEIEGRKIFSNKILKSKHAIKKAARNPVGFRRPISNPGASQKFRKILGKGRLNEKLKFENSWIWSYVKQLNDFTNFLRFQKKKS